MSSPPSSYCSILVSSRVNHIALNTFVGRVFYSYLFARARARADHSHTMHLALITDGQMTIAMHPCIWATDRHRVGVSTPCHSSLCQGVPSSLIQQAVMHMAAPSESIQVVAIA